MLTNRCSLDVYGSGVYSLGCDWIMEPNGHADELVASLFSTATMEAVGSCGVQILTR